MNENIEEKRKLILLKFRISTKLNYVLFPIDGRELIEATKKIGYRVPQVPPAPDMRVTIAISGNFAQKGETILDGSADRCVLGATAKSYDQAIAAFDELSSLILNDFNVNIEKEARFYEIMADFQFNSISSPLKAISGIFKRNQFVSSIAKILKQNISMFTLRFVTEGKVPNQEEWLDITIEPSVMIPNQRYNVAVIFRSKDKSIVYEFGRELESRVLDIIKAIEKNKK